MFVKIKRYIMNNQQQSAQNQQFIPEMEEFFDTPFPECEATKHFHLFPSVLEKYSPYGLNITPSQYKELMTAEGKFTYRNAGMVFNVLVAQTMKGMEMDLDDYIQFTEDVTVSAKKWNDDIQAKHKELAGIDAESKKSVKLPVAEA